EMRPFGLEHVDGGFFARDRALQALDLNGLPCRLVFAAINAHRRGDDDQDRDDVERPKAHARAMHWLSAASCGTPYARGSEAPRAGASVRSAARRRAERARGLRAISMSPGVAERTMGMKVGAAANVAGECRETFAVVRERSARNVLTIRSSSEWKLTTARRPPGASTSSAANSALRSSPSSSFTAMRSAWKVRVA